jgi:hypothetical protein
MRGAAYELGGGDGACAIAGIGDLARSSDRLNPGQELKTGQRIVSRNGMFALTLQGDGNPVLTRLDTGQAFYGVGTVGSGGIRLVMQTDGNLVLYDGHMYPRWSTGTQGNPGAFAVLQDDANLVVYLGLTPLWSSKTVGAREYEEAPSLLESIGETFLDIVNVVAPFAQTVISFVPGVGAVVNGAIAACISLAQGKHISDALIAGTVSALPGGPLAKAAFSAGVSIVKGQNVGTAALNATRDALPGGPAAKAAFDIAVSLAAAQQIQQGNPAVMAMANEIAVEEASTRASFEPGPIVASIGIARQKIQAGQKSAASRAPLALVPLNVPTPAAAPMSAPMSQVKKAVVGVGALGMLTLLAWRVAMRI